MIAAPESVTAVIPCHNAALYIGAAIDSVLAQSQQTIEIVIVDDGSTDSSSAVLSRYPDRVRVIPQSNQGAAAARNRAIEASESSFVAFLDADDLWHPEKIALQLEYMRAHPRCGLVFCDRRWVDASGAPVAAPPHRRPTEPSLKTLVAGNFIQPSTVLLRRSALGALRFESGIPGCEDWDLWLRLATVCEFGYLARPLVDYRLHTANVSRHTEMMTRGFLEVITRALERGLPDDVALIAQGQRRQLLEALGHLEFERQNWDQARRLFEASDAHQDAVRKRLLLTRMPFSSGKWLYRLKRALANSKDH